METSPVSRQIRAMNWPYLAGRRAVVGAAQAAPRASEADVTRHVSHGPTPWSSPGDLAAVHAPSWLGSFVTDADGVIHQADPVVALMLDVPRKNLVGKPLAVLIPIEDRAEFRRRLATLKAGRRGADQFEVRRLTRRVGTVHLQFTVHAERSPDGSPPSLRWIAIDITERKQEEEEARRRADELERRVRERTSKLEEALRSTERAEVRLRTLLHGLGAIVWEADAATGRFTFVSRASEMMLGHPSERWVKEHGFWEGLIHPDDRDWATESRARAIRGVRDLEFEYRARAASGRYVWVRESVRVVPDGGGVPRMLRGLIVNVTRWKKAERRLHYARSEMAARLADLEYLRDLSSRLAESLDWPEVLREILSAILAIQGVERGAILLRTSEGSGLQVAAASGVSDELIAHADRLGADVSAIRRSLETGRPVVVEDIAADPAYAGGRWLLQGAGIRSKFVVPIVTRSDEVLGVVAVVFDEPHRPSERQVELSELYARQASDVLEQARLHRELVESDRRKGELLAILGHELRSPLGPILNALSVLQEGDGPGRDEAAEVVARQVLHLSRIIDNLMDASRIGRGSIALHRSAVDLAVAVAHAVEVVRPQVEARGHVLEVDLPPGRLILEADRTRLVQILTNLLSNAARYTEPGGRIGLSARVEGTEVVVRVRDTGVGLAEADLARIFDLFTQAEGRPCDGPAGLGIGLALVKGLAEAHGGSVSVRSAGRGQGSEFTVRLPIGRPAADEAVPADGRPVPPPRRILVVDDDADSARMLARLLRRDGHEVAEAFSGPEALERLEQSGPDVIFLDLGLPGLDGYEVARRARARPKGETVRIVALSGFGADDYRRRAREAGCDRHLIKPASLDDLRACLDATAPTAAGSDPPSFS
jgi:PAS domain S-box-containing protein